MLEGASPVITGFEVAGRRPLDFKSYATSIDDMFTIRKKYEGMPVYIEKAASDNRTGKWYTLKTLTECGLTQSTINNWGTDFSHWKLHGNESGVDLSSYVEKETAGQTAKVNITQDNRDVIQTDQNGKTTLNSFVDQIVTYVKINLGTPPPPITVVDQVEEGNANAVTSNAVALVINQINTAFSQLSTVVQSILTTLNNKADLINGKVPASQLPSYVDDVLDFDTYALMVAGGGQKGFIYVVTADPNTNLNGSYRWSGSAFVKIDASVDLVPYTKNVDGGSTLLVQPENDVVDQYTLAAGKGLLNVLFSELSRKVKTLYTTLTFKINTTTYFRLKRNATTITVGSGVAIIPLAGFENFDAFNLNVSGAEREVTDITGTFYDGQYIHLRNTGSGTLSFSHGAKFQTDGTYPIKLLTGDVVVFEYFQGTFYQITGSYFRAVSLTLPGGGGGTTVDLTPYTKNADGGSTLNVTPETDVADQYTLASGKGILDVLFSNLTRKVKVLYTALQFTSNSTNYFRLKRNSTTIAIATGETVIALGGSENFDVFKLNVTGASRDMTDITGTFYDGQLLYFRNTGSGTINFVHNTKFKTDGTYNVLMEPNDVCIFEFHQGAFYQVTGSYYRSVTFTLPGAGGGTGGSSVNSATIEQVRRKLDIPAYIKPSVLQPGVFFDYMFDITASATASQVKARIEQAQNIYLSGSLSTVPANGFSMSAEEIADVVNSAKAKKLEIIITGPRDCGVGIQGRSGLTLRGINNADQKGGVADGNGKVSGSSILITDISDNWLKFGNGAAGLCIENLTIDYPGQNLGTGTPAGAIQYPSTILLQSNAFNIRIKRVAVIGNYTYVVDSTTGINDARADLIIDELYSDGVMGGMINLDRFLDIPRILNCHQNPSMGNYAKTVPVGRPCLTSAAIIENRLINGQPTYKITRTDQAMLENCFAFANRRGFRFEDSDAILLNCNGDMTPTVLSVKGVTKGRTVAFSNSMSFVYGGNLADRNAIEIDGEGYVKVSNFTPMGALSGAVVTSGGVPGRNAVVKVIGTGNPVLEMNQWDADIPSAAGTYSKIIDSSNSNFDPRFDRLPKTMQFDSFAGSSGGAGGGSGGTIFLHDFNQAAANTGTWSVLEGGFTISGGVAIPTANDSRGNAAPVGGFTAAVKHTLQARAMGANSAMILILATNAGGSRVLYANLFYNGSQYKTQIIDSGVAANGGLIAETGLNSNFNTTGPLFEAVLQSGVLYVAQNYGTAVSYILPTSGGNQIFTNFVGWPQCSSPSVTLELYQIQSL